MTMPIVVRTFARVRTFAMMSIVATEELPMIPAAVWVNAQLVAASLAAARRSASRSYSIGCFLEGGFDKDADFE